MIFVAFSFKIQKKITTPLFEPKPVHFHIASCEGMFKVQLYESNLLHNDSKFGRGLPSKAPAFIPCSNLQKRKCFLSHIA